MLRNGHREVLGNESRPDGKNPAAATPGSSIRAWDAWESTSVPRCTAHLDGVSRANFGSHTRLHSVSRYLFALTLEAGSTDNRCLFHPTCPDLRDAAPNPQGPASAAPPTATSTCSQPPIELRLDNGVRAGDRRQPQRAERGEGRFYCRCLVWAGFQGEEPPTAGHQNAIANHRRR